MSSQTRLLVVAGCFKNFFIVYFLEIGLVKKESVFFSCLFFTVVPIDPLPFSDGVGLTGCLRDSWQLEGGINIPKGLSVARMGVMKCNVWVAFLCCMWHGRYLVHCGGLLNSGFQAACFLFTCISELSF